MTPELERAMIEVEGVIQGARVAIGPRVDGDREWWDRHRAVMASAAAYLTAALDARITDRWDGCRVRIAGISATCTAGMAGALSNWLAAAQRRAAP